MTDFGSFALWGDCGKFVISPALAGQPRHRAKIQWTIYSQANSAEMANGDSSSGRSMKPREWIRHYG
jgi:hypothetical protein